MELVWVRWLGSTLLSPPDVQHRDRGYLQQIKPTIVETVGILIRMDTEVVQVAQSWFKEGDTYRDVVTIPSRCVENYGALTQVEESRPPPS